MSDLHTRYTSHMQVKCVYYIAQHLLTHGRMHFKILTRKIFQIRTVQLIIALYSIVEKTRSGRHPRSSEKSFSTSTDGFRRHGASREAALDSKMLLKAVLIVCVVRKERKANCCASAREFYFFANRRGAQATESREEGPTHCCSESRQPAQHYSRDQSLTFFGPRSYDASGEVGGYLYKPLEACC
jgi:hypothetical protein